MNKINKVLLIIALILLAISSFLIISVIYVEKESSQIAKDTIIVDSSMKVNDIEVVSLTQFKSKDLYVKNCKFCHGERGKGDGIKARLDSNICPFDLTKEAKPDKVVYYVILNGTQVMPDHQKMNDDQIWMLVVHIKEFKEKNSK